MDRDETATAMAAMDAAAETARQEYEARRKTGADHGKPEDSLKWVEDWWLRWYRTAGHKRLGRVVMNRGVKVDE